MLEHEAKEKLSLLADDRLDAAAAMKLWKCMETDRELGAAYSRYLLIGESLRSKGKIIPDPQFVDRVHAAIASEPRVLAPVWAKTLRDRGVTLALAATLAGLAVLVGESVVRQYDLGPPGLEQQARTSESADIASNVDTYLVNHNGTSYLAANGGLLPYLRVVSHGTSGY
jgi:hypothetical protein